MLVNTAYNFLIGCSLTDIKNINNADEYLMKKDNIKRYLTLLNQDLLQY